MADPKGPEIVSLDDLLSGGSSATEVTPILEQPFVPGQSPVKSDDKKVEPELDAEAILAKADPEFAKKLDELKSQLKEKESEVSIPDVGRQPNWIITWFKQSVQFIKTQGFSLIKTGIIAAKDGALGFLKASIEWLKGLAGEFGRLRGSSRIKVLAVFLIPLGAFWIGKKTFTQKYLPQVEARYLRSVGELATKSFHFDPDSGMEEFDTPLRQPEYIVLIDRYVVNLAGKDGFSSGMGMFELYVEANTREGAIEVKDREREVRDLSSRITERMSYEELVTEEGKTKLKRLLRRGLNEKLMSAGRVRSVYFQNVILKPPNQP